MLSKQDAQDWLNAYGQAWIDGDPDAAAGLFHAEASYHETPFDEPMVGAASIRDYWQQGAASNHRDVSFTAEVFAVENDVVVANWRAKFTQISSGKTFEMDGSFKLTFDAGDGKPLCTILREWWHIREID